MHALRPAEKLCILAERNPEARILACESSQTRRLAELTERLAAHAGRIECRLADATALSEESAFDLVLADVPCSGTGTLGRNPEIRHRLRAEDLPRHAERQRAIYPPLFAQSAPAATLSTQPVPLSRKKMSRSSPPCSPKIKMRGRFLSSRASQRLARTGILTAAGAARLLECLTPEGALRLLPGVCPPMVSLSL